jgi:hypothetical protein
MMSARVIRFPPRRCAAVWILRDDGAWLVVAGSSGWLYGDRRAAIRDAQWLARNLNLPIRDGGRCA